MKWLDSFFQQQQQAEEIREQRTHCTRGFARYISIEPIGKLHGIERRHFISVPNTELFQTIHSFVEFHQRK